VLHFNSNHVNNYTPYDKFGHIVSSTNVFFIQYFNYSEIGLSHHNEITLDMKSKMYDNFLQH